MDKVTANLSLDGKLWIVWCPHCGARFAYKDMRTSYTCRRCNNSFGIEYAKGHIK